MTLRIGLVGCGNISDIYLTNAALFKDVVFTACADLRPEAATAQGAKYGIPAITPAELLGRDDVDLVLNLTIPAAHAEISLAAIAAGKHVYTEKPLATSLEDGRKIMGAAKAKGVRVGSSPDTILGPGVQTARHLLADGTVGEVVTGTASVMGHGMEHWHPNPTFFFKPGGGPVLDMGPYYISALVHMLGPVKAVRATGKMGFKERLVTAEGPMKGEKIKVETLTTVNALLSFQSGAEIVFLASWDVFAHNLLPLELHGTKASMRVPDPNFFGGKLELAGLDKVWSPVGTADKPFGALNWPVAGPEHANYRGLGIADMASAIKGNRPHVASGDVALHVLSVMLGALEAADTGRVVEIAEQCERPAAFEPGKILLAAG
ncbi:Gfo/Idh/MocA family protein [Radicibacter daui]|uniref:Gfo/Idh/MocA family protein n=1 Tax=Radicibacter daui TaxID=3064829 RepID=UPI004046DF2D